MKEWQAFIADGAGNMVIDGRLGKSRRAAVAGAALLGTFVCLLLVACSGQQSAEQPSDQQSNRERFSQVESWILPVAGEAGHADLVATPGGDLLLSWVQPAADGVRQLRMARLQFPDAGSQGSWSDPVTVASGADWFLNWADTPHVFALPDDSIWAHWLRKSGDGPIDYGIELVRSGDDGRTWSSPSLVNLPDLPGDHGFVTFWPQSPDELGIAWLDSRQKAQALASPGPAPTPSPHDSHPDDGSADAGHGHEGGAPMMLRAATYGSSGSKLREWPLDVSTCDCCTTASAITSRGPVVVYRGRSDGEIRDTRLVRLEGDAWTAPRDVHADGWHIAGCPVNGPVVVAEGATVWVAWYTEAGGEPEVRIARSDDAGDRFGPPLTVAVGPQVLGRLGLALADGHVLVSWLREHDAGTGQRLMLSRTDRLLGNLHSMTVAAVSARGRASGIPRLAVLNDAAWLAWVEVAEGRPVLRGAVVR